MDRINFNLPLERKNPSLVMSMESMESFRSAILTIEKKLQEIDERILKNLMERRDLH
ncbi:MAG: hypothetical protein NTZ48_06420 [Candidatus Omnitrophica bacterium]|nr:hypothetical protein [Candidatus Omnitrophota bacterium]